MSTSPYPGFPEPDFIPVPGGHLAVYQSGTPTSTPPILLIHGWPEIAYSWKHQMAALGDAGFRVIALDLKGFGHSHAPHDASLYDITHMAADIIAVMDALAIRTAILCGHDWGGAIVWPTAVLHPERVDGVIGICTPHLPAPKTPPLGIIEKRFGAAHYFVQFQEPGKPEAIFTGAEEKLFRTVLRKPVARAQWPSLIPQIYDITGRIQHGPEPKPDEAIISPRDMNVYIEAYRKSGFHGGCNLYRNLDRNWSIMKERTQIIHQPCLWVGADLDLFIPPEASVKMDRLVSDLERHVLEGCGHWVMWERPHALNALMIDWLDRRFS